MLVMELDQLPVVPFLLAPASKSKKNWGSYRPGLGVLWGSFTEPGGRVMNEYHVHLLCPPCPIFTPCSMWKSGSPQLTRENCASWLRESFWGKAVFFIGRMTNPYKWVYFMVQYTHTHTHTHMTFHQYSWHALHSLHNWHLLKTRFGSAILVSAFLRHTFRGDILLRSPPTLTALILQLTVGNFQRFSISYKDRSVTLYSMEGRTWEATSVSDL